MTKDKNNKLLINVLNYKKYYAFVDIESYNDISSALPYDISIYIMLGDTIIEKYCILYIDVFNDDDIQNKCYYKNKIPMYEYQQHLEENKDIDFIYLSKYEMCRKLNDIINKYDIRLIIGYNIGFDYRAINRLYTNVNNTIRRNRRRHKDFKIDYRSIPSLLKNDFKKVNYFDVWYGLTELFIKNPILYLGYARYCIENDFITDSYKSISSREEIMFKYFIDQLATEWHLGFKDVIDEIQLFKHFKQMLRTRIFDKKHILQLNSKAKIGIYSLDYVKRLLKQYNCFDQYKDKFDFYASMQ